MLILIQPYSIERALQESGIGLTWLTGDQTIKKRDENLNQFRTNRQCNVLLASIQAAGVGIDLRCAQNVYMMVSHLDFVTGGEEKPNNDT